MERAKKEWDEEFTPVVGWSYAPGVLAPPLISATAGAAAAKSARTAAEVSNTFFIINSPL